MTYTAEQLRKFLDRAEKNQTVIIDGWIRVRHSIGGFRISTIHPTDGKFDRDSEMESLDRHFAYDELYYLLLE